MNDDTINNSSITSDPSNQSSLNSESNIRYSDKQKPSSNKKSFSKWQLNVIIILFIIIIIILLFIVYMTNLGNVTSHSKNSIITSHNIVNPKSKNHHTVNTNICKKEGSVISAMFPVKLYPNQPSTNVILQDQNVAAKNWENNAYLVTSILSAGITAGPSPHQAYVYASNCTKDLLIYYGTGSGVYTPPNSNQSYDKPVIVNNINTFDIPFNAIQLSDNVPLPLSLANNFPTYLTPQTNGPIIYNNTNFSNPSSNTNNITINNKSFYAQDYTIQINNSKKLGMFYDVMFYTYTYTQTASMHKLVALATISSTGSLLTLKTY